MSATDWWSKPRKISVVVDNDSWILPYAEELVAWCNKQGDDAILCRNHDEIREGIIAFYLGCIKITPSEILDKNKYNMVVHESDLPKGRGFAPMTWQILEGINNIPICLFEASDGFDEGNIALKDVIKLDGHELCPEWRDLQGQKTIEICQKLISSNAPIKTIVQQGKSTSYKRRNKEHSRLDPNKTIAEQFQLLRVVDNYRYPAFFDYKGHRYKIKVEKYD